MRNLMLCAAMLLGMMLPLAASAQNAGVYPPLASACSVIGGDTWSVPSDGRVEGYEGCTVYGQPGLSEVADQIECPSLTEFDLAVQGCVYTGIAEACPNGHFYNDSTDSYDCQPEDLGGPTVTLAAAEIEPPELVEQLDDAPLAPTDAERQAPELGSDASGTEFVSTDGSPANCRAEPSLDAAVVAGVDPGVAVTWAADGNSADGWQGIITPEGVHCFISAGLLEANQPPPIVDDEPNPADVAPTAAPASVGDSAQKLISDGTMGAEWHDGPVVTTLPHTGNGSATPSTTIADTVMIGIMVLSGVMAVGLLGMGAVQFLTDRGVRIRHVAALCGMKRSE